MPDVSYKNIRQFRIRIPDISYKRRFIQTFRIIISSDIFIRNVYHPYANTLYVYIIE